MNITCVNSVNFGAKIQFENSFTTKNTLKGFSTQIPQKICTKAKRIFIIPIFFSAILSRIIKVKKSIKLPS